MLIRDMVSTDADAVLGMMRLFYDSPAVLTKAGDDILRRDFEDCVGDCPLLEGLVFEENGEIIGYSMLAKCYATEFGGMCIWVEDLYFKEGCRGGGRAKEFFAFIEDRYKGLAVRYKLEVEEENEYAMRAYFKEGYSISPYHVMTKEINI